MKPCEYKQAFASYSQANAAKKPSKGVRGMRMHAYHCPHCGQYHIGKRAISLIRRTHS